MKYGLMYREYLLLLYYTIKQRYNIIDIVYFLVNNAYCSLFVCCYPYCSPIIAYENYTKTIHRLLQFQFPSSCSRTTSEYTTKLK